MGDAKMTKYERKLRRRDWANRVLSVVLSFAMVTSSTPIPAGAAGEGDAATAATQPTTAQVQTQEVQEPKAQAQQEQAPTEASVTLNLSHAYLTVSGQTVTALSRTLTVPTTRDLTFDVAADSGYEVSEVYTSQGGARTVLGTTDGTYTIPAASLADGLAVCVFATQLPQASQEEATATPLAQKTTTSARAQAPAAKTPEATTTTEAPATEADDTAYVVDGTMGIADLLGEARFYGIVADTWRVSEAETNAAVKQVTTPSQQTGNDLTNVVDQPWYIGSVTGGTLNIKGNNADVYTPSSEYKNISPLGSTKITFHETSQAEVSAFVDSLKADASGRLAGQVGKQSFSTQLTVDSTGTRTSNATGELTGDTSGVVLDITSKPAGTYYVNAEALFGNADAKYNLKAINKNADQVIFLNFPTATSVDLNQLNYNAAHSGSAGEDSLSRGIVWNMPNAATVNVNAQQFGIFFMPNADLNINNGYNSGWIVAKSVQNDGGKEFHNVYQEEESRRGKTQIEASKTLDGKAPGSSAGQFSFQLKDESGNVLQTKTSDASGKVTFDEIDFRENIDWNNGTKTADGRGYEKTFNYTVSEVIPQGATDNGDGTFTYGNIVYDGTPKPVKVRVVDYGDDSRVAVTVDYDDSAASLSNRTSDSEVGALKVTKALAGDLTADQVTDDQKAAMTFEVRDANGRTVRSFTYADMQDGSITVGNLVPGTYTVAETNATVAGYASTTTYDVEGGTVAVAADQTAEVTVTNTYSRSASATFTATKTLEGASLTDGLFSFTAQEVDAAGNAVATPQGASTTTVTGTNDASGNVTFGTIEYGAEGEHDYVISETNAGQSGYTYDARTFRAHVSVTRDAGGQLQAMVTYPDGQPTFANSFTGRTPFVSLAASKVLTGSDLAAGEFTFAVYTQWGSAAVKPDGSVVTATNDASGQVTFPAFSFKDNGWCDTYKIVETNTGEDGVSYDSAVFYAKITRGWDATANDNVVTSLKYYSDAACTQEVSGVPTFHNNKKDTSAHAQLRVTKALSGRAWQEGDAFDFVLTPVDGSPMPQGTKADGTKLATATYDSPTADFGEITYQSDGTYLYKVQEVEPVDKAEGLTYDTAEHAVTVTVSNGNAVVDYGNGAASLTVTNTQVASTSLQVTKALSGRDWGDADSFSFTLTAGSNTAGVATPMPSSATATATKDAPKASFGQMTFTKAGTYTYTVKEDLPEGVSAQSPTKDGITYDTTAHTVTVVVAPNADGVLTATPQYGEGASSVQVTNTYAAAQTSVTLTGTKTVNGQAATGLQGTFTLTLAEADAQGQAIDGAQTLTAVTGDDGSFSFPAISFSEAGTHYYKLDETNVPAGYTKHFDDQVVRVDVADDGLGHLAATTTLDRNAFAGFMADNTYAASGNATLQVTKRLVGRDWKDGDSFSFTLTAGSNTAGVDTPMPSSTTATATKDSPVATFGDVTFAKAGTYHYTMTESLPAGVTADNPTKDGVTYDTTPVGVTVTVTDQGNGQLSTAVAYEGQHTAFANTYDASGSIAITGTKAMDGRDFNASDQYAFTVTALTEGAPLPENPTVAVDGSTLTGKTTDLGFGKISYQLSDLGGASSKTFTYQVAETRTSGEAKGVSLDSAKTFSVTVTDQGNGTLSTQLADGSAMPAFTNTYAASGSFTLAGVKTIANRSFRAGDEWTFTVAGSEGAPLPTQRTVTIDPTSGTSQGFSFGDITYALADAGHTYTYTVTESGTVAGVTNDGRTHTVEVSVADKGDGTLAITPTYKTDGDLVDGLAFTNTYKAAKTGITISGTKTLEGRDIAEGEFQVALYPADENFQINAQAMPTYADVAANGSYSLSVNTYVHAGAYHYVLKEVDTNKPGVTYDTTEYHVTVNVTDDLAGQLHATVSGVPEAGANFANTFTAATAVLKAHKTLTGGSLAAGQFSFQLRDAQGNLVDTKANDAAGDVQFDALTYSQPGEYQYTISEVLPQGVTAQSPTKDGVTYDTASHPVTVKVDDDMNVTYSYDLPTTFLPAGQAPVAQFTNTYAAQTVGFSVSGTKALTGANLSAGQFTFTLKDNVGNPVGSAQNEADGSFTISTADDLIKQAGTYTYTLVEGDAADGITNDANASRTVTVKVSDNKRGQLVVDSVEVAGGTTFANAYAATGSAHFEATKQLTGATLKAGQFSFTLSKDGTVLQTKQNDASGKVTFDDITYTMADLRNADGTYAASKDFTYTIAEANDGQGGVAYDGSTQTVVVHVANQGDGSLAVTYDNGANTSKVFTNTYAATGTASLSAAKQLTGRTLAAGEFTFALTAGANDAGVATPMPEGTLDGTKTATNSADGLAAFGQITYDQAGTYHYAISEVAGDEEGMTYDPASYDVTVNVADQGDGTMAVTYGADQSAVFQAPVFKNTYDAKGSATVTAVKSLAGRALNAGEFSFQLSDASGAVLQTATNAADGTVTFQPLSYSLADLAGAESRDFAYTIAEVQGNLPGVAYDTTTKAVTVHASLNKATGTIDTTVTGDGATATFANSYQSQSTGFSVSGTKTLTGRSIQDGEFSVALYATDAQGNLTGDAIATAPVAADGTYTLATPSTLLTAAGTYAYKVVEVRGSDNHVAYDATAKDVTVSVTDNTQTGKLEATVDTGATAPAFANAYSAQGSISLKAHKTLTGRALAAGQFTFQATGSQGAPLPAGATNGVATATNDAQGNVTFAGIPFTQDDAGKTYTYTISEVVPQGATDNGDGTYAKDGYTYDGHSQDVKVSIADNGDGTLHITYGDAKVEDMPVASFANAYAATGSTTVTGHKTVNGADRTDLEGKVTFALTGTDGTNLTATTQANGDFSFGQIAYDQDDAGKTYTYTLSETSAPQGYTKAADQTFTVQVRDNGDGTLTATKSTGEAVFQVNDAYAATGTAHFEATKQLTGATLKAGQFSFTLSEGGTVLQTVQNDDQGRVAFSDLSYTLADVGTHTYTIAEAIPAGATRNADGTYTLSGVTYDGSTQTVKVTVSDKGDGTLAVAYEGDANTSKVFTNTYRATGQAQLSATKQLTGRTLAEGEFTFQLRDEAGAVLQAKANAADGTVTFDPISYDQAGTYRYAISEVAGDEEGMTYDPASYDVTVNVADQGDGTMAVTYGADQSAVFQAPVFKNTYDAKGSATITAVKSLAGRALNAGEFSFQLSDASGAVLQTATNAADGTVTFQPLSYSLADLAGAESRDFAYTIAEVQGNLPGVAYDTTAKAVTVHASLNKATGTIDTTVTGDGASATFANSYTASGVARLSAAKTLNGQAPAAGQFAFTLSGQDGTPLQTVRNDAQGTVTFADIAYTQADAGKSFTYTIAEAIPQGATSNADGTYSLDGVTYDGHSEQVTVNVTDKGDGTLAITYGTDPATATAEAPVATFANTYQAAATGFEVAGTKTLNGQAPADSVYTFRLVDSEGAEVGTATNAADGTFSIRTADDLITQAGTTTYTLSEVIPEGATDNGDGTYTDAATGVTYDGHAATVTVNTMDNGKGQLEAAVSTDDGATAFANTQKVSVTLTATKALTGNQALADGDYAFELLRSDGSQLAEARNTADGTVSFPAITYSIDDLKDANGTVAASKTFAYTMREEVPGSATNADGVLYQDATPQQRAAGGFRTVTTTADGQATYVTYDTTEHPVTVTLTCRGGLLSATVEEGGTAPTFTNDAFAASASLSFDKHFFGQGSPTFTFVMQAADANWAPRTADGQTGATVESGANATVFDDGQHALSATVHNSGFVDGVATVQLPTIQYAKPGTYYYLLFEEGQSGDGFDATEFLVTVTVGEDGTATATYQSRLGDHGTVQEAGSLAFYNNQLVSAGYRALSLAARRAVSTGVTVQPLAKKTLDGSSDIEANAFLFSITDNQTGQVLETVGNASDGQVAFGSLRYTKDMLGGDAERTFTYTIAEQDTGQPGVTYDRGTVTMSVKVALKDGRMTVTQPTYTKTDASGQVAYTGTEAPTFQNATQTVKVRIQKRTQDLQGNLGEGLVGAVYGMWMVSADGSQDVYMGNQTSDVQGYMTFDVPITEDAEYYFQEEKAPEGHLVDPYPSRKFRLVKDLGTGSYHAQYE